MVNKYLIQAACLTVAAALFCGGAYWNGYRTAKREGTAQIEALRHQYQQTATAAAQEYAKQLEAAADEKQKWFDFAQTQSEKLAHANRELDARAEQLKREIDHVVQQDKNHAAACSGLATRSLQLYNRALGYPD